MIRIAISQSAFDAIARTMPFGSVNFEAGVDDKGERFIWLPRGCRSAALATRSWRELQPRDNPHCAGLIQKGEKRQLFAQRTASFLAILVVMKICFISHCYAQAERSWMSGNTLLASCRGTNRTESIGYFADSLDMYNFTEEAEERTFKKPGNRPFCIPDSVTIDQLADVVVQFLDTHPTHRHYAAASLLAGAFMAGFPCPQ